MPDPNEKITIGREELAEPERITIHRDELPTDLSPPPVRQAAVAAILLDDPPRSPSLPAVAWIAVTLVPFANAWIWWRYAPAGPPARNLCRAAACLLGVASLLLCVSAVLYVAWPRPDWIEQAASRADRGVVLIESQPDSMGTGFVIASDGDEHLILTNRHVIADPEKCRVASRVGPTVPARVVGYPKDDEVDLALLLVRIRGLRPVGPIADFRDVNVGEPVVAIGHPLGLDYTVTSGIVSAKRGGQELQTSAAISPGNSGGPLINKHGHVLGVNTRTIDPTEGQSLSFAIRADVVLNASAWKFEHDVARLVKRIER